LNEGKINVDMFKTREMATSITKPCITRHGMGIYNSIIIIIIMAVI